MTFKNQKLVKFPIEQRCLYIKGLFNTCYLEIKTPELRLAKLYYLKIQ